MHILISNDDGYLAPGIIALAEALTPIAQITVVAPDSNRSGASNSLTLDRPLTVQQATNGVYFINGTPSDCVHIALTGLLIERPDLVVSGINQGQNMGDDTLYSGTVAAATEGHLFGIPAIAFSQVERGWLHLDGAARMAREIVERLCDGLATTPLDSSVLLNVNIPNLPYDALKGTMTTRLGRRHQAEPVYKTLSPHGQENYWIGPPGSAKDAGIGTDFYAVANGYVAVTPLQINLTHTEQLHAIKPLFG